ncbi:MAG: hypothetical protein AAB858_01840 [Patescibacteria group bacterium]
MSSESRPFSSTIFLICTGILVAWLSYGKWTTLIFVLVVSFLIVVFGALPPKESAGEPNVLYFDLSAKEGQTKTTTYKKYFVGMLVALVMISIPSIVRYYFL